MKLPKPDMPKILLLEADATKLPALRQLLAQWEGDAEFDTIAATSGEEALRYVTQHDFAAILLDLRSADSDGRGLDGPTLAAAIHARPRAAATPVILVTPHTVDVMAWLANYQTGTADVLFTPVIAHLLLAKIGPFVRLAHQAALLKQQTGELMSTNQRLQKEVSERQLATMQSGAKDEFLALLGHELRSPLAAITSAASIVTIKNVAPEKAERAKGIIRRQTQNASRMVEDLLDLGRAMSGKIVLERERIDIARLIDSSIESLRAAGRTAEVTIRVHAENAWVDADPARLEQIIAGLLETALKSTPTGGEIEITARAEDEQIVLVVSDSGPGIARELLPHVFDGFGQGSTTTTRPKGALGIGLALIRRLVELHGGSVRADSNSAQTGSAYTVRLPQARPEETVADTAAEPSSERKCSVLLIEDNDDGREMMCMLLTSLGNHVLGAETGKEGLRLAASGKPDIALIDIGLPGIDGYEVARRLRADPSTRGMRLVALTGHGLAEDQHRALEAGFDLHLVKPVSAEQLMRAVTLPQSAQPC